MSRAIVCVTNDLTTDNRVHRTCTALRELGFEVLLVGRRLPHSAPLDRPYATHRMRLLFRRGPLFYSEYSLRLFLLLLFTRARLVVANDLDTLLPVHLAARLKGWRMVYDSHEFFTEVPELQGRLARRVWLFIERALFPGLKCVITVNRSIAKAYQDRYGVPVAVVRNMPMPRPLPPPPARSAMGLPTDRFILVLQGAGINVDRGGEEAVLAMRGLKDCLLLIIGSGDAWPTLQRLVTEHELAERVRLVERLPYERMMDLTRNADLGLTLDKDTNLNYRYSLPNKLFDYIQAGIPVLATDLPEVAAVVREFDLGVVIPEPSPDTIVKAVRTLQADPGRLAAFRANATFAARTLDGAQEMEVLKGLLKEVAR